MGGHRLLVPAAVLASGLILPAATAAERRGHAERAAPQGSVVMRAAMGGQPVPTQPVDVRPVQVRPVIVAPSVVTPPRVVERPSFGGARPMMPPSISRQGPTFQQSASGGDQSRRRSSGVRHRGRHGVGVVVAYPVAYPFAVQSVDPPGSASYSSYRPVAPPRTMYSNVESVTPGPATGQSVECGSDACGGVGFDIAPSNAQVSVDGVFVGTVEEFSATSAPLVLSPGDHYIEVRLPGYRTASVDVTIVAGEVTPLRGVLEPLRTR